jgi:hypothetical protein
MNGEGMCGPIGPAVHPFDRFQIARRYEEILATARRSYRQIK